MCNTRLRKERVNKGSCSGGEPRPEELRGGLAGAVASHRLINSPSEASGNRVILWCLGVMVRGRRGWLWGPWHYGSEQVSSSFPSCALGPVLPPGNTLSPGKPEGAQHECGPAGCLVGPVPQGPWQRPLLPTLNQPPGGDCCPGPSPPSEGTQLRGYTWRLS